MLLLLLGVVLGIVVLGDAYQGYDPMPGLGGMVTGLAVIGGIISAYWLTVRHRMSREVALWQGLLRQLEGEFAGAEFHRSTMRLLMGQAVRAPTITPHFNEWHPGITRLGWLSRSLTCLTATLVPVAFLLAWVALGILPWVVP